MRIYKNVIHTCIKNDTHFSQCQKLTNYLNKHSEYGDLKFNMIYTVVGYSHARNTVFTISTHCLLNYCFLGTATFLVAFHWSTTLLAH